MRTRVKRPTAEEEKLPVEHVFDVQKASRGEQPWSTRPSRERAAPPLETVAVFVDCPQSPMQVMREVGDIDQAELNAGELKGAFIKVCPTVRASERQSIDARAIVQRLRNAGAAAVVVAPIVVPDGVVAAKNSPKPIVQKPDAHLRAWLDGVKTTKTIKDRALEEALTSVQEAGL